MKKQNAFLLVASVILVGGHAAYWVLHAHPQGGFLPAKERAALRDALEGSSDVTGFLNQAREQAARMPDAEAEPQRLPIRIYDEVLFGTRLGSVLELKGDGTLIVGSDGDDKQHWVRVNQIVRRAPSGEYGSIKDGATVRLRDRTAVLDVGGLADNLQGGELRFFARYVFENGMVVIDRNMGDGRHALVRAEDLIAETSEAQYGSIERGAIVRLRDRTVVLDPGKLLDGGRERRLRFSVANVFEDGTVLIDVPSSSHRHALVRAKDLIATVPKAAQHVPAKEGTLVCLRDRSAVLDRGRLDDELRAGTLLFMVSEVFEDGTVLIDDTNVNNAHALVRAEGLVALRDSKEHETLNGHIGAELNGYMDDVEVRLGEGAQFVYTGYFNPSDVKKNARFFTGAALEDGLVMLYRVPEPAGSYRYPYQVLVNEADLVFDKDVPKKSFGMKLRGALRLGP